MPYGSIERDMYRWCLKEDKMLPNLHSDLPYKKSQTTCEDCGGPIIAQYDLRHVEQLVKEHKEKEKMQVKLIDFKLEDNTVLTNEAKALATVQIGPKGYWVKGMYNLSTKEFTPDVLGDPYEIEEYYDEIKKSVKER